MALAQYLVIGSCRINGVEPGGVVDLDDEAVNVNVLFAAGHVKPVDTDAAEESPSPDVPDEAAAVKKATASKPKRGE